MHISKSNGKYSKGIYVRNRWTQNIGKPVHYRCTKDQNVSVVDDIVVLLLCLRSCSCKHSMFTAFTFGTLPHLHIEQNFLTRQIRNLTELVSDEVYADEVFAVFFISENYKSSFQSSFHGTPSWKPCLFWTETMYRCWHFGAAFYFLGCDCGGLCVQGQTRAAWFLKVWDRNPLMYLVHFYIQWRELIFALFRS